MASDTSRNISDLVQAGDNDDQANSIDREDDDAEVWSEGDMSDRMSLSHLVMTVTDSDSDVEESVDPNIKYVNY